jgi:hypothetical protein
MLVRLSQFAVLDDRSFVCGCDESEILPAVTGLAFPERSSRVCARLAGGSRAHTLASPKSARSVKTGGGKPAHNSLSAAIDL